MKTDLQTVELVARLFGYAPRDIDKAKDLFRLDCHKRPADDLSRVADLLGVPLAHVLRTRAQRTASPIGQYVHSFTEAMPRG